MLLNWEETTAPSMTKATIITTVRMTAWPPAQGISHFLNIYDEHVLQVKRNKIDS